jgi:hypothetical protein
MIYRKYEIWHDESKVVAYHHGILLIPADKRELIYNDLKIIRDNHKYKYEYDLKFAGVKNNTQKGNLIREMLQYFSHIIQTKIQGPTVFINPTGKDKYERNYNPYLIISDKYDCKFGLLRLTENEERDYFISNSKKIETTLRYILKGCCHAMFSKIRPIEITKLYFDGDQHHECNIDLNTILNGNFREYCKISNDITCDTRHMSERNDDTKLIMNLVDNVTGAWRSIINKEKGKHKVTRPLHDLVERVIANKIYVNKNSRWYRSINLSDLRINGIGNIEFLNIFRNSDQQVLF